MDKEAREKIESLVKNFGTEIENLPVTELEYARSLFEQRAEKSKRSTGGGPGVQIRLDI